jgi:hypothetical protein
MLAGFQLILVCTLTTNSLVADSVHQLIFESICEELAHNKQFKCGDCTTIHIRNVRINEDRTRTLLQPLIVRCDADGHLQWVSWADEADLCVDLEHSDFYIRVKDGTQLHFDEIGLEKATERYGLGYWDFPLRSPADKKQK